MKKLILSLFLGTILCSLYSCSKSKNNTTLPTKNTLNCVCVMIDEQGKISKQFFTVQSAPQCTGQSGNYNISGTGIITKVCDIY
jgi:hypothetical protein